MKKTVGFLLGMMLFAGAPATAQEHPLDPLSQAELSTMVEVLKADSRLPEGSLYPTAVLKEPAKAVVKAWKPGQPVPREAFVVVLDRKANKTYEAVVDVVDRKVVSWKHLPGVQPGVLVEEFATPREIVRNDAKVKAALKKRGIEDVENVQVDTWAAGILDDNERAGGARLLRCLLYYRPPGNFNPHNRPIEGLVAVAARPRPWPDPPTRARVWFSTMCATRMVMSSVPFSTAARFPRWSFPKRPGWQGDRTLWPPGRSARGSA